MPVEYGVPQGSILGPTLFLVYINELCNIDITNGKIITFADDTVLVFSSVTWQEVFLTTQEGFNSITNWLRNNILTLNIDKTKYMAFSYKNIKNPPYANFDIIAHSCTLNNTHCNCIKIERCCQIKYLGIIVDQNLNFSQHIQSLVKRLRKLIFIFKTLRRAANISILKSVYFALCQSIISYCITCWGGAPKSYMLELERAQRAILKVSLFLPFYYPTVDLYKTWSVLTVRQLFIHNTILKKHSELIFQPELFSGRRRKYSVCSSSLIIKHKTSSRYYYFLSNHL